MYTKWKNIYSNIDSVSAMLFDFYEAYRNVRLIGVIFIGDYDFSRQSLFHKNTRLYIFPSLLILLASNHSPPCKIKNPGILL